MTVSNEDLFTALVLVLSEQIDVKMRSKGTTRTGDYTREAIDLIRRKKPDVLRLVVGG